jgi:hypothetical protein
MSTNLQHLSDLVGGQIVRGEPSLAVSGLNSISEAQPGEITFLGNPRYLPSLKTTRASAVLIASDFNALSEIPESLALIGVENPTLAFSSVIRHFGPPLRESGYGVDATASVSSRAIFDPQKVSIGPCAVIEDDVRIDAMINVLQSIVDGTKPNHKNKLSINYFKNHSKEAAAYVLDKIMEMDEDCFGSEDEFEDKEWNSRLPNLPPRVPLSPALQALITSSASVSTTH